MGLVLWTDCFLLRSLVLTVLPPLFQLKVDEFPHHPGLRQADGRQAGHPERKTQLKRSDFRAAIKRSVRPAHSG